MSSLIKSVIAQAMVRDVGYGVPSQDQVSTAVDAYLQRNPVEPGATTEEAAQIRQNTEDVGALKQSDEQQNTKIWEHETAIENLQKNETGNGSGGNAEYYPDWSHLKWYVMGDSLTSRDNAHTDKRYYDFVQEKTGIQIIVDGIGGTGYGAGTSNSQSFLDRVKNIPDDVDVVTIFGSGNDILHLELANIPSFDTLAWLAFNRPGLRVIVVPPSPWKDYNKREDPWKAYCDRLQVCALACDFRYVSDMYDCPPFNGRFEGHMEKFFTTDLEAGIHPNELGHEMLAQYFYNALLQELALKV